ncbi:MAG: DUF3568 family protein [Candidatus Omnitrophica bacterium]|nr:DUF3568 family protein [Candidatus Omnitrophota bacterium]
MIKLSKQGISGFFLLSFILMSSGCVPLVIGAAAGVGGYAWVKGELANDVNVSAEHLRRAASRAVRDMKLKIKEDKGDRLTAKIVAEFSDGTDVNINITAKTERSATIAIRVGLLGDKEKSQMIFAAIQKRL